VTLRSDIHVAETVSPHLEAQKLSVREKTDFFFRWVFLRRKVELLAGEILSFLISIAFSPSKDQLNSRAFSFFRVLNRKVQGVSRRRLEVFAGLSDMDVAAKPQGWFGVPQRLSAFGDGGRAQCMYILSATIQGDKF